MMYPRPKLICRTEQGMMSQIASEIQVKILYLSKQKYKIRARCNILHPFQKLKHLWREQSTVRSVTGLCGDVVLKFHNNHLCRAAALRKNEVSYLRNKTDHFSQDPLLMLSKSKNTCHWFQLEHDATGYDECCVLIPQRKHL